MRPAFTDAAAFGAVFRREHSGKAKCTPPNAHLAPPKRDGVCRASGSARSPALNNQLRVAATRGGGLVDEQRGGGGGGGGGGEAARKKKNKKNKKKKKKAKREHGSGAGGGGHGGPLF